MLKERENTKKYKFVKCHKNTLYVRNGEIIKKRKYLKISSAICRWGIVGGCMGCDFNENNLYSWKNALKYLGILLRATNI